MRLCLYQPEIPHNTGAILRLAACLDVAVDIVEPCGFSFADSKLRRVGLDYRLLAHLERYPDWTAYESTRLAEPGRRLILATAHGATAHVAASYRPGDVIVFGRESDGAPAWLHARAALRVAVPVQAGARSLNLAVAAGMILGEGLRQTGGWPTGAAPGDADGQLEDDEHA